MRALSAALLLPLSACVSMTEEQAAIEQAATQPLRDTRIADEEIPEALQLAAAAPYSTRTVEGCEEIRAEIAGLDAVLGPDADVAEAEADLGAEIASAATRTAISSLIPGLGIVRILSGANRHQKRVEAAVHAGSIRRSFLKGLGAARGCAPPAAPASKAQEALPEIRSTGER